MPVALAAIPAAVGLYQTIAGGIRAKKARKALENQPTPSYAPSKAINDYYQMALNKATSGAYNTQAFQNLKKSGLTGLGTGINSLTDRRAAIGNTSALVNQFQNNMEKAAGFAENLQNQNFARLGQATGMKSGEEKYAFGINAMFPYQQQRQLYGAQFAGGNQLVNAGLSNIGNAANTMAQIGMANQIYGNGGGNRGGVGQRNPYLGYLFGRAGGYMGQ